MLAPMNDQNDDNEGDADELSEYEIGFLDAYMALKGIEEPGDDDFRAAFDLMAELQDKHERESQQ
jgi:hypothetical protein